MSVRVYMVDVLLVDDNLENTALFTIAFGSSGYTVYTCSNGLEALNYIERCSKLGQPLPRIVVTDVNMPEMDGYELCYTIKNTQTYANIPVILFTAVWPELTKKMALTVTPDDYVLKPVEISKLLSTVKAHIK